MGQVHVKLFSLSETSPDGIYDISSNQIGQVGPVNHRRRLETWVYK